MEHGSRNAERPAVDAGVYRAARDATRAADVGECGGKRGGDRQKLAVRTRRVRGVRVRIRGCRHNRGSETLSKKPEYPGAKRPSYARLCRALLRIKLRDDLYSDGDRAKAKAWRMLS